jgi:hypothetical protein
MGNSGDIHDNPAIRGQAKGSQGFVQVEDGRWWEDNSGELKAADHGSVF